ncbi:uncharacterized protein LOC128897674 [Dryobates pubescens]|uniref:uncharacterized protein LOC128897674 n=1 Tax=Dryobates pubescens TaxID=118200 RepID=UPI0023B929F0|nr:uncharacterized protein LOC128897674 [Dryobates pubescens]
MSRDPRYYEPDPIKAPRSADSAAPAPAPVPARSRQAPGPAGESSEARRRHPPRRTPPFPLQPRDSASEGTSKLLGVGPAISIGGQRPSSSCAPPQSRDHGGAREECGACHRRDGAQQDTGMAQTLPQPRSRWLMVP